ncbi:MAG: hypothetical protein KJO91_00635 [Gammaproteobacteria bacterium]|nr:hypothetical protein [Gammaproteobacteria bacterium]
MIPVIALKVITLELDPMEAPQLALSILLAAYTSSWSIEINVEHVECNVLGCPADML